MEWVALTWCGKLDVEGAQANAGHRETLLGCSVLQKVPRFGREEKHMQSVIPDFCACLPPSFPLHTARDPQARQEQA